MGFVRVYNRAADGFVGGRDVDYAIAHSTGIGDYSQGTLLCVGQNLISDALYRIRRTLLSFDTSWIGGRTILRANLVMTPHGDFTTSPEWDVAVKKFDWPEPIGDGNYEAAYDGALAATTDVILGNTADFVVDTPHTSPDLDISWINTTGITRYSLVSSRDILSLPPIAVDVNGEHYHFYSYDGGTKSPYLLIEIQGRPLWQPNPLGQMNRHLTPLGV